MTGPAVAAAAPLLAVTGADGFMGKAFCAHAIARGRRLRRFVHATRADDDAIGLDLVTAHVDDLTDSGKGDVAEMMRPFYIEYLRKHGVKA